MELASQITMWILLGLLYLAIGVGFISLGLKIIRLFKFDLPPNKGLLYGLLVLVWPAAWIYGLARIIAPGIKKIIYLFGDLVYITAYGDYVEEEKKS